MVIPHYDSYDWNGSMERRDVVDYRFLSKTTTRNQFMLITYILFLTKLQKRQTRWNGFALLKNDITGSEPTVKMLDSSDHNLAIIIKGRVITCWIRRLNCSILPLEKNNRVYGSIASNTIYCIFLLDIHHILCKS